MGHASIVRRNASQRLIKERVGCEPGASLQPTNSGRGIVCCKSLIPNGAPRWDAEWKARDEGRNRAARKLYGDYPKTDIEGALGRYNLIRVGRKMPQDIVDL